MDRHDEAKDVHVDHDSEVTPPRDGDVLGLGGAPVPKQPGDPTTAYDPESVAQRRARARAGEEEAVRDEGPDRQSTGATGIDMGSGGHGTDISGT